MRALRCPSARLLAARSVAIAEHDHVLAKRNKRRGALFKLRTQPIDLGVESPNLFFERKHTLYSGEVEALVGQTLDLLETFDVCIAVSAAAAPGACRVNKTLPLVNAKRLRVYTSQLGRDRDDIDSSMSSTKVH